ncbi:MAG: 50S ribosome-binding GTPase, partial [Desulfofustis sp.]|nr:50S ribosome-binding GTPase [Desulfofustis sp.]
MLPEIAIIGHPNEGKSSVLSTLAEDDSVRISPYPGETTVCRAFPVTIDNRELIRFVDTPGFQNPSQVLAKLKTLEGSSEERLHKLLDYCGSKDALSEDFELLKPISRGAALIYVVNGARPARGVDRDEMEIIRLIGKPRMAVINNKGKEARYLAQW